MSVPWGKRADMVVHECDPYNAEPPPAVLAEAAVTPVEAFYVRNHGPVPEVDPATWALDVDGLVDTPLRLGLTDLRERFDVVTVTSTLQCAGNRRAGLAGVRDVPGEDLWGPGATSTARWTGVRLGDVLDRAGVADGARHVVLEAPDVSDLADPPQAYAGSVPLEVARAGDVLLAWAMNDEALPAVHGAPVRVVVPGYVGARSVKWVRRVGVRAEPCDGFFQARSYRLLPADADPDGAGPGDGLPLGPVGVGSAVLDPQDGAEVTAGPLTVRGYALTGRDRSVARVDVSADGGASWHAARLAADGGPGLWRLWECDVEVAAGTHEILARAWDSAATLQPERPEPLWNPKGYVNHSWPRITVHAT